MDLFAFDRNYRDQGYNVIAGVDEAGRGPWAGPVVAAAVILPPDAMLPGVNDSKKLTPQKREKLFAEIQSKALGIGVEVVDHATIDAINILQATYRAMRGALRRLSCSCDLVLVDGCWPVPELAFPQQAIIGGDAKSASIAAASIIAKVTRDRIMTEFAAHYPAYLFEKHKGYGTPEHQKALELNGPCPIHRQSFAPVQKLIAAGGKR